MNNSIETGVFQLESDETSQAFVLSAQSSVASSNEAASFESLFSRASSLGFLSSLSMGSWQANILHSCYVNQITGNYIAAAGGISNAAADGVSSRAGSYSCIATMRCKGDEVVLPCVALAGTHRHHHHPRNRDDRVHDLKGRVRRHVCSQDDEQNREDFSWLHCGGMLMARGGAEVRAVVRVGERVFSAHEDHKIRVWANGGCKLVAILPTLRQSLMASLLASNYVQVRRHQRRLWMEHVDAISALAVAFRPDGMGVLYSGSWDRTVKVWRLSDFKCVETFRAHDDAVNAMAVSADGSFLYTGSADGKVGVWEAAGSSSPSSSSTTKHSHVATLDGHKSAVNALALSPDGSLLYSGACDKAIIVWQRSVDQASRHMSCPAGALRGHRRAVLCLASVAAAAAGRVDGSIHNHIVCSGSADKTIRVWQRVAVPADVGPNYPSAPHICIAVLHGHAGPVKCLTVVPPPSSDCSASPSMDSVTVYSGSLDRHIKVWTVSLLLSLYDL